MGEKGGEECLNNSSEGRQTDRDDRGPTNLGLVQLATNNRISHAGRQFLIHLGLRRGLRAHAALVWKEIEHYEYIPERAV